MGGVSMERSRTINLSVLILLLLGLIFSVSSAFAFFQDLNVSSSVDVIVIQDSVSLVVTEDNDHARTWRLVPENRRLFTNDAEMIVLNYDVETNRQLAEPVNLIIEVSGITINQQTTYAHLVDVSIVEQGPRAIVELYEEPIRITVQVRLIEPIDEAEALALGLDLSSVNVADSRFAYHEIAGENIRFELHFTLENQDS